MRGKRGRGRGRGRGRRGRSAKFPIQKVSENFELPSSEDESEQPGPSSSSSGPLLNPIVVQTGNTSASFQQEMEFSTTEAKGEVSQDPLNLENNPPGFELMVKDGLLYRHLPSSYQRESSDSDEPEGVDSEDDKISTEDGDDSEDEWEEQLVYLDLDDIPNVQELFAKHPDEFLLALSSNRQRDVEAEKKKPTFSKLLFKFHNLDTQAPILQIGDRFFEGTIEEPIGTSLFFQTKSPQGNDAIPGTSSKPQPLGEPKLPKINSDLTPPPDPVFGDYLLSSSRTEYELIAKSHKTMRMTRRRLQDETSTYQTPSGLPPHSSVKLPPLPTPGRHLRYFHPGYRIRRAPRQSKNEEVFKRPKTPPPVPKKYRIPLPIPIEEVKEEVVEVEAELIVP